MSRNDSRSAAPRPLPPRPNLDYLRKLAKERLVSLRAERPEAQLADAQRAVAREYGFASWRKLKAHVESVVRPDQADPIQSFFEMIRRNGLAGVKAAIEAEADLTNSRDEHGASALGVAVEHDRSEMVELLLMHGAEPSPVYAQSAHLPLSWAMTVGAFKSADVLLRHGVKPDLFCAAGLGTLGDVRSFFASGRLRPEASQTGSTRYDADGNRLPCPPPTGREVISDALYIACRNGRAEVVRLLLEHEPDLSFRAYVGGTPLHWAHFNGTPQVIEMLLRAGADAGLRDDSFDCVPRSFGICVPASWGITQLVRSRVEADPDLIDLLDGRGTPLWEAARAGQADVVQLLLEAGADPHKPGRDGRTPLELARTSGHETIVKLLASSARAG